MGWSPGNGFFGLVPIQAAVQSLVRLVAFLASVGTSQEAYQVGACHCLVEKVAGDLEVALREDQPCLPEAAPPEVQSFHQVPSFQAVASSLVAASCLEVAACLEEASFLVVVRLAASSLAEESLEASYPVAAGLAQVGT